MEQLVLRIVKRWIGEGKSYFVLSKGNSSGNVLVALYQELPMGTKDTSSGVIYKNLLVGRHLIKYEGMFVEPSIYIRYVVLTIAIFTSMLAIELFYLTQLRSFLVCFFE